jgi:hypothetical protein
MSLGMGRYHQDLKIAAPYCIVTLYTRHDTIVLAIFENSQDPDYSAEILIILPRSWWLLLRPWLFCRDPDYSAVILIIAAETLIILSSSWIVRRSWLLCQDPDYSDEFLVIQMRSWLFCQDPDYSDEILIILPRSWLFCQDPDYSAEIYSEQYIIRNVLNWIHVLFHNFLTIRD